jgi:hypothetical protein
MTEGHECQGSDCLCDADTCECGDELCPGPELGKYKVSVTYQIVRPDDEAEPSEAGFEVEPEEAACLGEVAFWLRRCSWSWWSGPPDRHAWLETESYVDPRTGESTSYGGHIEGEGGRSLTASEARWLGDRLGVRL